MEYKRKKPLTWKNMDTRERIVSLGYWVCAIPGLIIVGMFQTELLGLVLFMFGLQFLNMAHDRQKERYYHPERFIEVK